MKNFMIGALLSIFAQATCAQVPQFKDYPAKTYNGAPAKLLVNNDLSKTFPTVFRAALKQKPNFAGEYVATSWGCGSGGCTVIAFVNKRTGQVVEESFDGDGDEFIEEMKLNSRLLVTKETIVDKNYNEIGKRANFYTINNSKLQLIKQIPAKD